MLRLLRLWGSYFLDIAVLNTSSLGDVHGTVFIVSVKSLIISFRHVLKRRTYEVSSIGEGFLREPPVVLFPLPLLISNISNRDEDNTEQIFRSLHCGINLQ